METPFAKQPYVIGIAGGTGSGKTTFSRELVATLMTNKIVYLSHDSYYRDQSNLSFAERVKTNYDHPDSLETDLMIKHIEKLRNYEPVDIPIYDFVEHTRSKETEHIEPQSVILIEGILIFAVKELRDLMDMKIFVDTDADIRFMRRLQRDIEERGRSVRSVCDQYLNVVRPMHDAFVEPSKRYADIIVPHGGRNKAALDMVATKIHAHLEMSSHA
ncbi:MAG: uridine kinase [Anaerolineaceae bacterium]|nr:uridine kinase [Anaerolineaceae bacterium]